MTIIPVRLKDRGDGGLRVTSADVPGLLLSGADRQHVWNLVAPTLKGLLEANHGLTVAQIYYPRTSPALPAPFEAEFFAVALRQAA